MADSLRANTNTSASPRTLNDVISETTKVYLSQINRDNPPMPKMIEQELLSDVNDIIALENMNLPTVIKKDINGNPLTDKYGNPKTIPLRNPWKSIDRLLPQQLAEIILFFHHIIRVDTTETMVENEDDLLAVYCDSGPNEGIYDINESNLYRIIKKYDYPQ